MSNETQPDNPPAFPRTYSCDASGNRQHVQDSCAFIETKGGMTLRDWFAGQALAGLSAQPDARSTSERDPKKLAAWRQSLAEADATGCYLMADAMLRAREAKP